MNFSADTTSELPLISVVMPVWNGGTYLAAAIDSILSQTFTDFELLIVDDGSTDDSPRIIESYQAKDPRVRSIRLNHEGIVVALNRGIAEARSEWIARMDCDDIAEPDRFATQWQALSNHPSAVLCHSAVRYIDGNELSDRVSQIAQSSSLIKLRLCFHSPITHPTVMFHKDAFEKAERYLAEERHGEDYGLWGRMIEVGDFVGVNLPLLYYRLHEQSISRVKLKYQCDLGRRIALGNCRRFFDLTPELAERAYRALTRPTTSLRDWVWVTARCFSRIPWDVEVTTWWVRKFAYNTLYRLGLHRKNKD